MTGNTKVWRAPLAGLASFAMIATMGLAAGTAAAATGKVTYDAGAGCFGSIETDKTAEDTTTGKVTQAATVAGKTLTVPQGYTFTGWYSAAQGGEKVDPSKALEADSATTVYAHYGVTDGGVWNVTFQTADTTDAKNLKVSAAAIADNADGDNSGVTTTVARGDSLAAWQVPTNNRANVDHKVADGWVAGADKNTAVTPTDKDSLAKAAVTVNGVAQNDITLNANLKAANTVTFSAAKKFKGDTKTYTIVDEKDALKDATANTVSVDVATGAKFSAFGELPVVTVDGTTPLQYVNTWATAKQSEGEQVPDQAFSADTTVDADVTVYPNEAKAAYTVTLHYVDGTTKDVLVNDGATLSEPSIPAKNADDSYEYVAAGWYATQAPGANDKAFDFSKKFDTSNHPTDLYALYKVSAVKLTFSYGSYADAPKNEKVAFKDGDTLTAPKLARSGWTLVGFTPNFPENATLVLKSTVGVAPTATTAYRTSDGTETDATDTQFTDRTFVANWTNGDEAAKTLTELEHKVNVYKDPTAPNKVYLEGKDKAQTYFTATSFDQYVKDFQAYLKDKQEAAQGGYTVAEYAKLIKSLQDAQAKLVEVGDLALYRAYNPGNGDHFFTPDADQHSALVNLGWRAEGAPYKVVSTRPAVSYTLDGEDYTVSTNFGTAVYSVYNPNTGEHLLVKDFEKDALKKAGWNVDHNEKPVFYTVQNGAKQVYRVYNPNTSGPAHVYVSKGEGAGLVAQGWRWDFGGNALYTLD